jgi:hypothetical protein
VSVHKRASQPVYGIAQQKRGFSALAFSMNTTSKMAAHPFAALARIHFRMGTI